MNAAKRILLADHDEIFLDELRHAIESSGWMRVVGIAADGARALELLRQLQPDVLVMDLTLAKVDGLQVVKAVAELSPQTQVYALTSFLDQRLASEIVAMGVRYLTLKPCDLVWVVDRIGWLCQPEQRRQPPAEQTDHDMQISLLLQKLWVPVYVEGYHCLWLAVNLVLRDATLLNGITKCLYPRVAKLRNSTAMGVERAIRRAIAMACQRGALVVLEQRYKRTLPKRPSNREFIALVAELGRESAGYRGTG